MSSKLWPCLLLLMTIPLVVGVAGFIKDEVTTCCYRENERYFDHRHLNHAGSTGAVHLQAVLVPLWVATLQRVVAQVWIRLLLVGFISGDGRSHQHRLGLREPQQFFQWCLLWRTRHRSCSIDGSGESSRSWRRRCFSSPRQRLLLIHS